MPVSAERIARDLEAYAQFGKSGETAVTRLALTPEDRQARAHFIELCKAEGMEVRIDRFGNIAAVLGGWNRPAFLMGSHLDSVPSGGRFDGIVGVVGGLEAIRALKEDGLLPDFPIGVVNLTAEESSRWGTATMGSKGMAGVIPEADLMAKTDRNGVRFDQAIAENAGFDLVGGPSEFGPIAGWLELHIEQAPELEMAGKPVGVVTHIAAPSRFKVQIQGQAQHSGATLMGRRKDALVAASQIVLGLEALAKAEEGDKAVATATVFGVDPVSINVIPGKVELGIDIRSIDGDSKRRVVDGLFALLKQVEEERKVVITTTILGQEEPVTLDPKVVASVEEACKAVPTDYMMMPSRAGHDTMYIARLAPAAMVFVPSKGGISHNPEEYTPAEQITVGVQVLAEAVRRFKA